MDLIEYIRPELLILIPALNVFGFIIKTMQIKDKHIPLILGFSSIILSCVWVMGNGGDNVLHALFTGVVQGVLCAGASVYGHQVFKQYKKDKEE